MLNINIICVGKIKENSMKDLISEYIKRLNKYCNIQTIEVDDEKLPNTLSDGDILNIKEKECNKILTKLNKIGKNYVIALDLTGKEYTSEEFSNTIEQIKLNGNSTISFVIGGTLGLTKSFLSNCNSVISFSHMTFTHQLIRLFLCEQLFRAFKIQNNENYHH